MRSPGAGAGALAFSGLLKSLLFGVGPRDPLTFAGVTLLLAIVALVAAYAPARRAAMVDPVCWIGREKEGRDASDWGCLVAGGNCRGPSSSSRPTRTQE
jgi:hypothetical protein